MTNVTFPNVGEFSFEMAIDNFAQRTEGNEEGKVGYISRSAA
jgi:hypothetical protein